MNTRSRISMVVIVAAAAAASWIFYSNRNLTSPPNATRAAVTQSETRIAAPHPPEDTRSLSQQMTDRFLVLLRAETDPAKREAAAQQAAQQIPRALLASVLADLQKETDRALAGEAARAILLRWAWEEPTSAAAWTTQFAGNEIRRDALAAVGAGWARQNPEALLAWSASLPPTDRDWVLLHGASYLARTDLGLFAIWLKALPATRELAQLTAQTGREWAARDPRAVVATIGEFSGSEHAVWREHMAAGLANFLSQANQLDTAFGILNAMPPGPEQKQVFKGVVTGWSQRDPAAVATWLSAVSDPPLRKDMSLLLASNWFERDAAAAEKWAVALPPGPVSDAVAERAAQYFAPRDRALAQRWTNRISAEETRSLAQTYVQAAQPLLPDR